MEPLMVVVYLILSLGARINIFVRFLLYKNLAMLQGRVYLSPKAQNARVPIKISSAYVYQQRQPNVSIIGPQDHIALVR
jgi:hypothetical protein